MSVTINGTTGVSAVQPGSVSPDDLVYTQSWQSPTRAIGTDYTNTTGQPIDVSISVTSANGTYTNLTVGGVLVATVQSNIVSPNITLQLHARVPPGAVYRIDGPATITYWREYR